MEKNKSVKRMDWRQKVLISILGSFIVILSILFYITYHYFVAKIETGNEKVVLMTFEQAEKNLKNVLKNAELCLDKYVTNDLIWDFENNYPETDIESNELKVKITDSFINEMSVNREVSALGFLRGDGWGIVSSVLRKNRTGTAKSSDDVDMSEKVDISIGGLSLFDSATTTWPTEVIKAVEEKFNCTITVKPYDQESLNLDLSGGNTTDIVQIADANIEGVLKGKHAVNLLDYKNIAPNIFSDDMNYRNTIMQNFKSDGDDTQYFVTPHVVTDNAEKNYGSVIPTGYVVRWDLYKQIGCPEINNDDDYIEALKAMKEIYPKTEDGLETYAMSAYNDSDLHTYFFKGCLGEGYVNLEDGLYVQDAKTNDLVVDVYDKDEDVKTPFWSGVEFYNKLYREGLLDPDNFITQGEDLTEKYTKGQYLGGTVNWFYGTYNTNNKGTDKEYIALPSKLGWVNEPNKAGWTGKYLFVSSHSPNIESK